MKKLRMALVAIALLLPFNAMGDMSRISRAPDEAPMPMPVITQAK